MQVRPIQRWEVNDKLIIWMRFKTFRTTLVYIYIYIYSFSSPRLVTIPRLKSPVCATTGGRIVGGILFSKIFALCWMQVALLRIWNGVILSISYDNNRYNTNASLYIYIYIYIKLIEKVKISLVPTISVTRSRFPFAILICLAQR